MQTRVSAAAGRRLRQQLEESPALREVLDHPAVLVTRRATARTARRVAPRTADRLIAELKGTEALLPEVRVLMGRTTNGTGTLTHRRATLRIAATLSAAAVIGTLLATVPASAAPSQPSGVSVSAPSRTPLGNLTNPQVFPRPQEQHLSGKPVTVPAAVTLVLAPQADPGALDAVREVLSDGGATGFAGLTPGQTPAAGALVVYVGGPGEESDGSADQALQALGAPSPAGLPAGGYVLAAGQLPAAGGGTYGALVLSGVDAVGTFHAAQSLRQLLTAVPAGQGQVAGQSAAAFGFPGVVLRDWPSGAPVRGVAESFFGTPWTAAQRLDQIDFLGRTKQNFFLYAPGDDPYRQAQWRDPYPAASRPSCATLADRARLNHVTLGYAIAPNQTFCYSSAQGRRRADRQAERDARARLRGVPAAVPGRQLQRVALLGRQRQVRHRRGRRRQGAVRPGGQGAEPADRGQPRPGAAARSCPPSTTRAAGASTGPRCPPGCPPPSRSPGPGSA